MLVNVNIYCHFYLAYLLGAQGFLTKYSLNVIQKIAFSDNLLICCEQFYNFINKNLDNISYLQQIIGQAWMKQLEKTFPCAPAYRLLTQRGMHQAQRNNSNQIFELMNNYAEENYLEVRCSKTVTQPPKQNQNVPWKSNDSKLDMTRAETEANKFSITRAQSEVNKTKKSVTFQEPSSNQRQEESSNMRSQRKNKVATSKSKQKHENKNKEGEQQKQQPKQKYFRECYSIKKYLESSKAYTRELPNSAIKLLYEKPCLSTFGGSNTTGSRGFLYGDNMKTHNIQPHRFNNSPKKYESYKSALEFGKRMKCDPEERWKIIHRKMKSKMDMKALVADFSSGFIYVDDSTLDATLKTNINQLSGEIFPRSKSVTDIEKMNKTHPVTSPSAVPEQKVDSELISSLKRSKSVGKKQYLFLYKYKDSDGMVRYAKDRHGITCYVDPTFQENKQAFNKFIRNNAPIFGEDIRKQDKNIDGRMKDNFIKSKEENAPRHYLIPNCDQPYRPQKYSRKARKKLLEEK